MSLPIVISEGEESWDCHQCGICCRGSLVPLSAEDLDRLQGQNWSEHPDLRGVPVVQRIGWRGDNYHLAQREDGSCVFLNEDGLCRIHAELGPEAKPTICRVFPLQLIPQGKQAVLTMRRACPSAAVDKGRPLEGRMPFVKKFLDEGRLQAEAVAPPLVKRGERRDWTTAGRVLAALARLLQDERFPPVRRLVHALQMVSAMDQARTKDLDDAAFSKSLIGWEEGCLESAQTFFQTRQRPTAAMGMLFRLSALSYARLHPAHYAEGRFGERIRLTRAAWRMVRGRGTLPHIHEGFAPARFPQLEEPLGSLDFEITAPLGRMIEASAASYLYAIANRRGWSIVESLRALALCFPMGMWMLRWSAVGRAPKQDDMISIVVALDRGQGHDSLDGWQHRWRLNTLGRVEGIERLAAWYAQ